MEVMMAAAMVKVRVAVMVKVRVAVMVVAAAVAAV